MSVVLRSRLIEALIVAKCARYMMSTCVSTASDPLCAVCAVLSDLGYEPYRISDGGLESWRPGEPA